ncbi:MAG: sulfurtransferase [Betaproteobacteria bacterium HGW-Betaproteobacteria-10]|nr:MAG: sulfurtransferase [Betaproteobacteria bacterium HGW-Betaproteobacteria-10]
MQHLEPRAAHAFLEQRSEAVLVDCRTETEHIKVKRLLKGDLNRPVLQICRSGRRSGDAAVALEAAGFSSVINVLEGFDGPLDADFHRSTLGGWRYCGLRWQQS